MLGEGKYEVMMADKSIDSHEKGKVKTQRDDQATVTTKILVMLREESTLESRAQAQRYTDTASILRPQAPGSGSTTIL